MERYEYLETVSSGAYGVCYKVLDTATGQHCAAKGIKQAHEDAEVMRLTLREVKILKTLPQHVNIVRLLEAFRSHSGRVYLVFEYVERSLYQELERHPSGALPGPMVKSVAWQLLHALGHCHDHGIMHRDIKPANVLLTGYTPGVGSGGVVKLCDFGFARTLPPGARGGGGGGVGGGGGGTGPAGLSSYVMTRWYRPPEVLVGDVYGTPIDIWSYGCMLAELATGRPLFPGRSTVDQLWRIMRCLGPLPPTQMAAMRRDLRLQAAWSPPQRLKTLRQRLPDLDPRLFEVVSACLIMDPQRRPTVPQLLQMPYFWDVRSMIANTDLARQLPYAADVACTISFRPPPAATAATAAVAAAAAVKPAAVPATMAAVGAVAGSAPSRTETFFGSSLPAGAAAAAEAAAAGMSNTGLTAFVTPLAEAERPPPLGNATAAAVTDAVAAATAAPPRAASSVASGGNAASLPPQPPPQQAPPALAPSPSPPPPPQQPQPQPPSRSGIDAGAAVYDVSYVAWSNSSNTGNLVAIEAVGVDSVTTMAAREASSTAKDLTVTTTAVAATAATASAAKRMPAQVVATAATAAKAATAAAAARAAATAAAATAATAAAAAVAANAAAAAAASAAATAAAAFAGGAGGAGALDSMPTLPPSLSPPSPPPPSLLLTSPSDMSTAPKTPIRTDLSATATEAAATDSAIPSGGDRTAAMAAASSAAAAVPTPSGGGEPDAAAAPARGVSGGTASIKIVNAASLFQALPYTDNGGGNGCIEQPAAAASTYESTAVVHHDESPAALQGSSRAPIAAAAASPMFAAGDGAAIAADPPAMAVGRGSLPYDVVSYSGGTTAAAAMAAAAASMPNSGGVIYVPISDAENAVPGDRRAFRPPAMLTAAPMAAGDGGLPSRQLRVSTSVSSRPESRGRYLRPSAAAAGGGIGRSDGGAVSGSGAIAAAIGGGGRTGGVSPLLHPAGRAISISGSPVIPGGAAAAAGAAGGSPRVVDPKYDTLSRFAAAGGAVMHDTHDSVLLTSELKYIGSPAGAPGLCQFVVSGAQLPHRRGPPLPAGFLFLSSPTDTQATGSIQVPESATGCGNGALTALTTAEVALPSGPIPGCTFEFDAYQSTTDQNPYDPYDTQPHHHMAVGSSPFTAAAAGVGGSPGGQAASGVMGGGGPTRQHSKLWNWALTSLRLVSGSLELHPQAHPHPHPNPHPGTTLQQHHSLQLQIQQSQTNQQNQQNPHQQQVHYHQHQLQQHQTLHHPLLQQQQQQQQQQPQPQPQQSGIAPTSTFTHTLRWLGSHGGGGGGGSGPNTGPAAAGGGRSEAQQQMAAADNSRSPFYTATLAAAAASGTGGGGASGGLTTTGGNGGGAGIGYDAHGHAADGFGGRLARGTGADGGGGGGSPPGGSVRSNSVRGGSPLGGSPLGGSPLGGSLRGGSVQGGIPRFGAGGGGGGGGAAAAANQYGVGPGGGGAVTGGAAGGGSLRKYSRRGKGLISTRSLPGWLFGPLHLGAQADSAAASSDTGSTGGCSGGGGGAANGTTAPGGLPPSPYGNLKQLKTQQMVLQSSHSYLHAPGDVATSTLSSTCLPPVEEPQEPAWVSSDVAGGAAAAVTAAAAAAASFHRSPSAVPGGSPVTTSVTATPRRVSVAAAITLGGGDGAATAPANLPEPAGATAAVGCRSFKGARPSAELPPQQYGTQPLYGRPPSYATATATSVNPTPSSPPQLSQSSSHQQAANPMTANNQPLQMLSIGRQATATALLGGGRRPSTKANGQRALSGSGSRSGSSRLGSQSFSNSGAVAAAAAAAAEKESRPAAGGCFPGAGAAFLSVFASFRSSAARTSTSTSAHPTPDGAAGGDSSAGGGGGGSGSPYGGSSRAASFHTAGGSVRGGGGGGGGAGGGSGAAAAEVLPSRLSTGRSGMSPLSDERRSSLGLPAAAAAGAVAVTTSRRRQLSCGEYGNGGDGAAATTAVGGDVSCCATSGYALDDDSSCKFIRAASSSYMYGTRHSTNTPSSIFAKPSATSSVGVCGGGVPSTCSGDTHAAAAAAIAAATPAGCGTAASCCCDAFKPSQTVGPTTIPESEEGPAAGLGSAGIESGLRATDQTTPAAGRGGETSSVGCGCGDVSTAPQPMGRSTAVAAPVPAAAPTAGVGVLPSTSWCLPGALASAVAVSGSFSVRKGAGKANGGGGGTDPWVGDIAVGAGRRPPPGTDDGASSFGRTTEGLVGEGTDVPSAASGSTRSGGGLRARLRALKLRVRELLVGS